MSDFVFLCGVCACMSIRSRGSIPPPCSSRIKMERPQSHNGSIDFRPLVTTTADRSTKPSRICRLAEKKTQRNSPRSAHELLLLDRDPPEREYPKSPYFRKLSSILSNYGLSKTFSPNFLIFNRVFTFLDLRSDFPPSFEWLLHPRQSLSRPLSLRTMFVARLWRRLENVRSSTGLSN